MAHLFDTYGIIAIGDLSLVDFSQVGEDSAVTVRKNLAETEFIIKWNHEPTFIADGTITPLQTLDHSQALALVNTPAWTEPIPEE